MLVERHRRAFALDLHVYDAPVPAVGALLLLLLHVAGVALIGRLTLDPWWLGVLPVLVALPLLVSARRRQPWLMPESLAPLMLAYGVAAARLVLAAVMPAAGPRGHVPEPWATFLDLNVALVVGVSWSMWIQLGPLSEAYSCVVRPARHVGVAIASATCIWALLAYVGHRTHGVTATDPFAYAQMAVDLATTGSPLHTFPLVPVLGDANAAGDGGVPLGYSVLDPRLGSAVSAWPPGYSVLLALADRLLGEAGLYVLTPIFGLAAIGCTWLLTTAVLRSWPRRWSALAAGIAVFTLATSVEQVVRAVVPMADIPAQCFSTLAVVAALSARASDSRRAAALAGVCLGLAFAMRYTQVLLLPSVLAVWLLATPRPDSRARVAPAMGICLGCAALVALPVLAFNWATFGSPVATGSYELALFARASIVENIGALSGALFSSRDFLWLVPLLVLGVPVLVRADRTAALVVGLWLLVVGGFHLPYAALRARDLLPEFPVLAVLVGIGAAGALRWLTSDQPRVPVGVPVALLLALFGARTAPTFAAASPATLLSAFGYLRPEQRAAFDDLAREVPPDGIVAASLNSGAIGLYARRDAIRPSGWSGEQWRAFVRRSRETGRRVFVLNDSAEMEVAVAGQPTPILVASLPLPYFSADGGSSDGGVALLAVDS